MALGAAAIVALRLADRSTGVWTDDASIRVPAEERSPRQVLWAPARPVAGAVNSDVDEYEPRLRADGALMVFVRRRPGSNADLFSSSWTSSGWSDPAPIEAINTDADELGPELSADGQSLYFYSDRDGGFGGFDLWVARASEGGWSTPVNLGAAVNGPGNEYGPALAPDGTTLYFSSNRPRPDESDVSGADGPAPARPWDATLRERRSRHDYDLYSSTFRDGEALPAQPLSGVNSADDDGAPAMSPAGDFLYFTSDRPGGSGGFDLYRVRLNRGAPGTVEHLDEAINSAANELDPALSADGFRLFFSSARGSAEYDIWCSVSREVRFDRPDRPSLASVLRDVWRDGWPWIVALAALLALLALLWPLLRDPRWRERFGRLSLLAKCLFVSIIAHIVIAMLLTIWQVGAGIGEALRASQGTRVVLATDGGPGDAMARLAEQVRADVASAAMIDMIDMIAEIPPASTPPPAIDLPAPTIDRAKYEMAPQIAPLARTVATSEAAPPLDRSMALFEAMSDLTEGPDSSAGRVPAAPRRDDVDAEAREVQEARLESRPFVPAASISRPAMAMPALVDQPRFEPELPRRNDPIEPTAADAPATADASRSTIAVSWLVALGEAPAAPSAVPAVPRSSTSTPSGDDATEADPAAIALRAAERMTSRATARGTRAPQDATDPIPSTIDGASPMPSGATGRIDLPLDRRAESPPATDAARDGTSIGAIASMVWSAAEASASVRLPEVPPDRPVPDAEASPRAEPPVPAETFEQRDPGVRAQVLQGTGGDDETERAVGLALEWFASHQSRDGRWSARHFDDGDGGDCGGAAELDMDVATTSLALLCFLSAGHTHATDGPYRDVVARALAWIVARQAPDGDLRRGSSARGGASMPGGDASADGPAETMYGQTIATVALCEAYAMTRDAGVAGPARRAVAFVVEAANASRRGRASADDTSVLGWQIMAVESARRAGIEVSREPMAAARRWLDDVASAGAPGRYAYRRGEPPSVAMTAESMFVLQLLDQFDARAPDAARMQASAQFILDTPPSWRDGAPTHHWYYATLALFQHGGEAWAQWNDALKPELVGHQRRDGHATGSWDPRDQWSKLGGRIYQTAVCTLSLEVYYRYRAGGAPSSAALPSR
ncbi:MAG: hypothetical protein U0575_06735 [Phycisphaerales bacterium]